MHEGWTRSCAEGRGGWRGENGANVMPKGAHFFSRDSSRLRRGGDGNSSLRVPARGVHKCCVPGGGGVGCALRVPIGGGPGCGGLRLGGGGGDLGTDT